MYKIGEAKKRGKRLGEGERKGGRGRGRGRVGEHGGNGAHVYYGVVASESS